MRVNSGTAFQLSINTIHRSRRSPSLQMHLQFIWSTIFARNIKNPQDANCYKLTCRTAVSIRYRRSLHIQLWDGLHLFTRSWLNIHRSLAFAFTFQTHQSSSFYRLLRFTYLHQFEGTLSVACRERHHHVSFVILASILFFIFTCYR